MQPFGGGSSFPTDSVFSTSGGNPVAMASNGNEEEGEEGQAAQPPPPQSFFPDQPGTVDGGNGSGSVMEVLGSSDYDGHTGQQHTTSYTPRSTSYSTSDYYNKGHCRNNFYFSRLQPRELRGQDALTVRRDDERAVPAAIAASLSLHPLAASELQRRLREAQRRSPNGQLDPFTTALLYRELQQEEGQPRSPLSPHTLQRCLTALAAGDSFPLTPEDVLAPAPLALTWPHALDSSSHGERGKQLQNSRVEVLYDDDEGADREEGTSNGGGAGWGRRAIRQGQKRSRDDSFRATNGGGGGGANPLVTSSRYRYQGSGGGGDSTDFGTAPLLRRRRTSLDDTHLLPQQQQQQLLGGSNANRKRGREEEEEEELR